MIKPLLSIILPVYNAEKYISKTIESVLNQMFSNFELIIVNDASTDNSLSICERYNSIDNRIVIVNHKINKGLHLSRYSGIQEAKGKYIGFIDADDFIDENFYKTLIDTIETTKSDIVVAGWKKVVNNEKYISLKKSDEKIFNGLEAIDIMNKGIIFNFVMWDKIYIAEKIKKVYFSAYRGTIEDVLFNVQAFYLAKKIYFIPNYGYNYVIRDDSLSHRKVTINDLDFDYIYKLLSIYKGTKLHDLIKYIFCRELLILFVRMIRDRNSNEEIYIVKNLLQKHFGNFISNEYLSNKKKLRLLLTVKLPLDVCKLLIKGYK